MKMKCNKIRNVEKSICTSEQKIAYNYAFSYRPQLEKIYNAYNQKLIANFEKSNAIQDIINIIIADCKRNEEIAKKYNIDAIIHALRQGIEKYINGYSILSSYDEIGKIFVIQYEVA